MPRSDDRTRKDLEILGLEISASEDDKKKAFIKLALKLHPDRFSKNPDDITKMRFHDVCKAYKRLTTDHSSTADWNIDRSDEIFFSLLADSLQHNSRTALYELFSDLPNHKSHFQNDNEYRIKEDVFDDEEDEDTELNRLIKILMNRLQNGKSLPAGLTQDRICKLKEDFMKQREASKRCVEDEKSSSVGKKAKPQIQVPVTKPKPKSKKQILAEQRRREREMAKIAEELDEKKKREGERENARRLMETEKQRKLEEEQRKLEEDRKRLALEAKKKKEREEREREQRQQKENERLEKLKKQQEEESRKKEEEKKRKAEEKAAKSKAAREAKEREEKEKAEQAKKQQTNKRTQANFQPQYQSQYQQQQQKYPREVPPRFLRQMMQRQQPSSSQQEFDESQHQQPTSSSNRQDVKVPADEDWDKDSSEYIKNVEQPQASKLSWSENPQVNHENWGQELSNNSGSLSDWGTVASTEDWDAPAEANYSDWSEGTASGVNVRKDGIKKDSGTKPESNHVGTIGSEVKSGKIPKKDVSVSLSENKPTVGQFGAIGQPVVSSNDDSDKKLQTEKDDMKAPESGDITVNKKIKKELMYRDVIERNSAPSSGGQPPVANQKTPHTSGPKLDSTVENLSRKSDTPSPKLTGWSGLDGFDGVPTGVKDVSQNGLKIVESPPTKLKSDNTDSATRKDIGNSKNVVSPLQTIKDITADRPDSKSGASLPVEANREADEWGWTTASSKKTKQKTVATNPPTKDANVWANRSLKQLLDMGFQRDEAEKALKENNGIIESAVSDLLSRTDVDRLQSQTSDGQQNEQVAQMLNEMAKKPNAKDQMGEDKCQIPASLSSNTPDKLNRKQRRKQIQSKPNEDQKNTEMNASPVYKESSGTASASSRSLAEKKPAYADQSFNGKSDKTGGMKDASQISGSQDAGIAKTKSVGVIGGQLPATSVSKFIASSMHSASSKSDMVTKDILTSLGANVSAANATALAQNRPHPSTQYPLSKLHQLSAPGTTSLPMAQGNLPVYSSDAQSTNAQNARIQYILQQQLAQMRVTPSQQHEAGHQRQHFPQEAPLLTTDGQLPAAPPKSQSPLLETAFAPASAPSSTAPAPQKSKLHQWTQPFGREEATTTTSASQPEQTDAKWNAPSAASGTSSTTTPSLAAVTVDPVSAKWGVLAAPRLSPTPSEFKPGVPWKPKAELERVDKLPTEGFIEDMKVQDELLDINLAKAVGAEKEKEKGTMRPPPGLNNVNSFEKLAVGSKVEPLEMEKPDLSAGKALESRLLSISGLGAKVDHQSLHLLCQQYGIVLSYSVGPSSAIVCFESPSQAQHACKSLNGFLLFESKFKTDLLPEEDKPAMIENKGINPHQGLPTKPFLPSHYPGVPVQNFWENGQMGPIAAGMNANMPLAPPHPVSGLPPTGMLAVNAQLGPWGSSRPEQLVNSSPFWPMNAPPQGLLSQVGGFGQWGSNTSQPLSVANPTTYAAVSPSATAKLLPDGLFNGSESM